MNITRLPVSASPAEPLSKPLGSSGSFVRRFRAAASGLAAGWRAAADLELLSRMPDGELGTLGIVRSEIPRYIHQRHFAGLGE